MKETADVSAALSTLLDKMDAVHQVLEGFADRGKSLDNCHKRMEAALAYLDQFNDREEDEYIRWLELRGNGFFLHRTPLDIADVFRTCINDYDCLSIFTSATLSVNREFDYFSSQLGLEEVKSVSWDSPFDFKTQSLLYLPRGLPDPGTPGFIGSVVENRSRCCASPGAGRFSCLPVIARCARPPNWSVRRWIIPFWYRGTPPRTELLETFRTTPNAVLLGTSSFWEGVDVRGQALSCVIIDKLPLPRRMTRYCAQD